MSIISTMESSALTLLVSRKPCWMRRCSGRDRGAGGAGDDQGAGLVGELTRGRALHAQAVERLAGDADAPGGIHPELPALGRELDGARLAQERVAGAVDQAALRVQGEGAAAGEALAGRGVDHEEAVAADRQVQRAAGLLQRAGGAVGVGGAHGERVAQRLRKDALGAEAGGVRVGQVVGDHLLAPLVVAQGEGRAQHPVDGRGAHATRSRSRRIRRRSSLSAAERICETRDSVTPSTSAISCIFSSLW